VEVLDGFEFQIVIEQTYSPDNLPITLGVSYRIAGFTICLAFYEARHQPTMGCSPHVAFGKPSPVVRPETTGCYSRQQAYIAVESRGLVEVAA